jgi:outer membrane murein-binding lipoprotein Lpp
MKPIFFLGALLLAGCATSAKIQEAAIAHDQRAAELESQGRYQAAAKERDAAAKERAKATYRAQIEAQAPMVPPTPLAVP